MLSTLFHVTAADRVVLSTLFHVRIVLCSPLCFMSPPQIVLCSPLCFMCRRRSCCSAHLVVLLVVLSSLAYSMPLHSGVRVLAPSTRLRCDPVGQFALRGEARPLSPPLRVAVTAARSLAVASSGALWPVPQNRGTCCSIPHHSDASASCRAVCRSSGLCTFQTRAI